MSLMTTTQLERSLNGAMLHSYNDADTLRTVNLLHVCMPITRSYCVCYM